MDTGLAALNAIPRTQHGGGYELHPYLRDARTQHWDDFTGINFAPSAPLYSDEDPDVMGPFRNTVDLDPSFNEPIDRFDENLEPFDKTTNPFFDEILEPFYEMYDPFDETADQTIDPTVFWTVEPTVFWTVEHTVDETVDPVMVTAPSVNTTITTVLIVASSSSATVKMRAAAMRSLKRTRDRYRHRCSTALRHPRNSC